MEAIISYFQSLDLDIYGLLKIAGVLLIGTILIGAFGRFVFGKKSVLSTAVSSAIGILFIYVVSVVLNISGTQFSTLLAPLPFVTIDNNTLSFSVFQGDYTVIATELLSMVILSFLVNLADQWMPKGKGKKGVGKNVFSWLFFRCLAVVIGYIMHLVVVYLFVAYLPEGIVTYAPVILLGLLVILLLTGALKILVGTILSATVNPLIGALYTFFFANIVGKQVTKAVLTTVILTGLVWLLNHWGVYAISITAAALVAYLPFLLILIVLWYLVNKLF